MKNRFSDKCQWGILEYLFCIYPRTMTEAEVCREFGKPLDKGLVANVRQLISEGSIEKSAIVKIKGRDVISPAGLRLSRAGTKLVKKSLHLN